MFDISKILSQIDFKKNQKQIFIFAGLVAVLIVFLYFNLLLKPQVMWVINSVVKMNGAGTELKNAKAAIAKIPKFKEDIDAYKEKVDSYERMLPAEQEIPTLLESLSGMAKSSGVRIDSITPVAKKEDKSQAAQVYNEIPILITARSGYHELGQFLSKLENSERFMKVVDIEVRYNKVMPKKHEVELLVLTYILNKGR